MAKKIDVIDIDTLKEGFTWLILKRIDPTQNVFRYYAIGWQETLFGWAVLRVYGRLGADKRILDPLYFDSLEDAWPTIRQIIKKRLRNGYVLAQELTEAESMLCLSFRWPPSPVVPMAQLVLFDDES